MHGPQHAPEFMANLFFALLGYGAFWLGFLTVRGIQELSRNNQNSANPEPSEPSRPLDTLQSQQLMDIMRQAQEAEELRRRLSQQPGPIWQNHRLWEQEFHNLPTPQIPSIRRNETDQPMTWRFENGQRIQQR